MSYTPGPWIIRDMSDDYQQKYTIEPDRDDDLRSVICRIADMELCPEHGGSGAEANARLIAAAPTLLEALKEITTFYANDCKCTMTDGFVCVVHRTKRAIAKAEGVQP